MGEIELVAIAATFIVGTGALALRRRPPTTGDVHPPELSHSLIRVLTTEEEVRAAVLRAAQFEEVAAACIAARTRRYHSLAGQTIPAHGHDSLDTIDS